MERRIGHSVLEWPVITKYVKTYDVDHKNLIRNQRCALADANVFVRHRVSLLL